MIKKIFQIGLVAVVGVSMLLGNYGNLFAANVLSIETSPTSIPKTNAGDANTLSVQETSKWTNTDVSKGEVNVQIKSAAGQGSELLKNQDIVFVSDISGSMTGERTAQMKNALKQSALAFLDPGLNNKVALTSFDDRVSTDYNLGNSYADFENAVNNISSVGKGGGGTNYEVGLKQAYNIIKEQGEHDRTPVVIFMTDGNPTSLDGIDLYQKRIKSLGATIYTVQYMNGSTITPILREIATSDDYAFNAVKTSYLIDIYNRIVNKVISSKSYKDVETKFEVRNANFDLKTVSVDVGTVTKNGNIITWKIPSLLSGTTVNLSAKVDLVDKDADGYLLAHKAGTVSYEVTGNSTKTQLTLDSTTLDRVMYNVKFDENGATNGAAPATYKAAATSMINAPSNPNGLGKTGNVFLGWSISGTAGLITDKTQMPNNDILFKAEWGTPTISMNTDTIYTGVTHIDKNKITTLANNVGNTVTSVEFVDAIDSTATTTYDLNIDGEEPIKAWITTDKLFIGSSGRITAPADCSNLFSPFKKARSIVFNGFFDTSEVTSMQGMFSGNNDLTTLDISSFDTSKVTDMSSMFRDQIGLTTLTLGSIDTSNVENMAHMFYNTVLQKIEVGFDTTKVNNMSFMFANCGNTSEFDLSTFSWTAAYNNGGLSNMFENTNSLNNKKMWVQSTEIKTLLATLANDGRWPTMEVKTTKRSTNTPVSNQVEPKVKVVAQVGADGVVDGGKALFDTDIDYKITVGFESTTASKSGVMKVTNIIPADITIDPTSIVAGAAVWDNADGTSSAPTGRIYDIKVENGKLIFYVKDLSVNSKIDLIYKAKTPATIAGTYKEILNQSSLAIEDVNITSNYVRHFLGDSTTSPTMYPLNYQYDGDVPTSAPTLPVARSYVEGQSVNLPKMSMSGYVFNGWRNGSILITTDTMQMPNVDTTLIGSWTKVLGENELKGSVTYKYEGTVPDELDVSTVENYIVGSRKDGTSYISEKTIRIPNTPTVDGYEFEGWTSANVPQTDIHAGSFQLGNQDIVLTGKWTKKKYTIKYQYADGSSVPSGAPALPTSQSVTWGEQVTTASDLVDINGFTFDGWYSDSNIDPDFQTTFEMPKEDVVLYAYWTKEPYTITYQYEGDKPKDAISLGTSKSIEGAPVSVWDIPESKETSKDGVLGIWEFNGWKSNQITTIVDGTFNMPASNVTLLGTWTFKPNSSIRTITFIIEYGKWADRTTAPINCNVELVNGKATLPHDKVPTGMLANNDYTDGQWLIKPNTDVNGITGNVSYTYRFVKKPVVTFVVENGSWADGTYENRTVALDMVDGKATLPETSVPSGMIAKDGYSNGHWVKTPNVDTYGITQDITYTFVYDKIIVKDETDSDGTKNNGTNTGDTTQFLPQLILLSVSFIAVLFIINKVKKLKQ